MLIRCFTRLLRLRVPNRSGILFNACGRPQYGAVAFSYKLHGRLAGESALPYSQGPWDRGKANMKANQTAVILIEFQNEFCKPGGKIYEGVKDEISRIGTIPNAKKLAEGARKKGCLVVHSPFVFDEGWQSTHCGTGILASAKEGGAFRPNDWGTALIDEIRPADSDVVLKGKRALSGFTNTNLNEMLKQKGIKNVAVCGFLTNVCVEATARTAYDSGYNVIIIKDACGSTSKANQEYVEREIAPVLGGAMTADEFLANLE